MPCIACNRDIEILAKGLCKACYTRLRRRGTTEYAPVRVRGACQIKDCERPHKAQGLCQLHYERLLATGDPEKTKRPDSWGAVHKHPMFNRWAYAMRRKNEVAVEWHDFLQFVVDVGGPPAKTSKLFKADDTKLLGPDNFVWKDAITQRAEGEDDATFRRRQRQVYRRFDKERATGYDLKKNYGMSHQEYIDMHEQQGGLCSICKKPETRKIKGTVVRLCVDHCHSSGDVRSLLCSRCNQAIGLFEDDHELIIAAAEYVRCHSK